MNLITPEGGLLFWMVIIFALLFFILAKFGFPVITGMVEKRDAAIGKSLEDAKAVEARMADMVREHREMLDAAKREQAAILKEASEAGRRLVDEAKAEARGEADKILADARVQIAAERESAMRDVRREAALLSVSIAEKILRKELQDGTAQAGYFSTLADEISQIDTSSMT